MLALAALGIWILHGFLPALAWAVVLAIALGPLYERVERRVPHTGHNILCRASPSRGGPSSS